MNTEVTLEKEQWCPECCSTFGKCTLLFTLEIDQIFEACQEKSQTSSFAFLDLTDKNSRMDDVMGARKTKCDIS